MIQVEAPGLLTTVQDLGRDGFGPLGVSASGAADAVALRVGNRLLGNLEGAAALELTLVGGTFRFELPTWIAVTGSDFGPTLDNAPVPMCTAQPVAAGQVLRVQSTRSGARCYLCVSGGIEVARFLASASTHVLSGLGGLQGRALRKGDRLQTGSPRAPPAGHLNASLVAQLAPRSCLRVTQGPQSSGFAADTRRVFLQTGWRVSEASNRMGLRLDGPVLESALSSGEMVTAGVSLGAVQVPPGGQPVIVFVEQQTTGGYPIIVNVIAADIASVGQLRPRDTVQFEAVSLDTARELFLRQEAVLAADELLLP
jgi:antagonist of KipI